jgi:S-adenosylmethionine:tRNA ribosyltransferase-isomerase
MRVSDFDYVLPEQLIAQEPSAQRESSRLLVVDRASGDLTDSVFTSLPDHLRAGDLLVLNNTRVFPARLIGRRLRVTPRGETVLGGRVEIFLVSRVEPLVWEALVKPGRSLVPGARVEFARGKLTAEVIKWRERGRRVVRFEATGDFDEIIDRIGRTPLPPYIKRDEEDRLDAERYQTVFARERGAVAAPTAGLHFTPQLLDRLRDRGVEIVEITLHVGYGTFQPVRVERVEDHHVEPETYSIDDAAAASINRALSEGRRVIAVGTTTTRAVESAARRAAETNVRKADGQRSRGAEEQRSRRAEEPRSGADDSNSPTLSPSAPQLLRSSARQPFARIVAGADTTDLFIYPGFEFQVIDGLVTNFHLPCSSLLMLVSAFGERELILRAYRHAIDREYRFYSYGDAMFIL